MNSLNRRRIEIIDKDIELIDKALESDDEIEVKNIHRTIDGKYQSCIANWGKSMYAHHLEYGFAYDHLGISLIVSTIAVLYDPHYIILLIFHTKSFLSDRTIIPCSK